MVNNNQIDIQLLENLIVGVEPHIYAFTTETVPNYLKVGDTYRPLEQRLSEWRKHFPELEKSIKRLLKLMKKHFLETLLYTNF